METGTVKFFNEEKGVITPIEPHDKELAPGYIVINIPILFWSSLCLTCICP